MKKKLLGSVHNRSLSSASHDTTLIISNDEMKNIIKIVKSLEDSGLLLKGVSETVQNEAKRQKGGFFSMLLGTLVASLLENMLAEKFEEQIEPLKVEELPELVTETKKVEKTTKWIYKTASSFEKF